ncbi:MAG: hypothetical protein LLF94_04340 [Chlamydiales bacterium]|nr:hypothetical protein [Chlamydiales bacterium]
MDDDNDSLDEYVDTAATIANLAIYDGFDDIPAGFTSAIVKVDASPASSLMWKEEILKCEALIKKGYKICFELDLGLFGRVQSPGVFQTLSLALAEFTNRLLEPFIEHVEACILYRSETPFASIETRDIQMDYLDLLRQELPDDVPVLLLFDCSTLQDPFEFARNFSPDRYSLFTLCLQNAPLTFAHCCWNVGKSPLGYIGKDKQQQVVVEPCSTGMILPRFSSDFLPHKSLLMSLIAQNIDFKIISEDSLAMEWDGLDILYVHKTGLAPTTLRMIDGFSAAGGSVIIDQKIAESV